jgi:spermidine synthase
VRLYLYATAVICGAAILIVEILGAKMLSPFFGASHFVWTAQIAVTLLSLAAGYDLGGRLADRSPKLGRMYGAILAAAIYLCVSVPLCSPVSFACLKMDLALGSLLASAFLFLPPLTLLATVGPFLVRNFTQSVSSVGGKVGRLSALSTLGSVGGTLLIGYALFPFLPNSMTMYLTAVVLMAVAVGYFFLAQRTPLGAGPTAVVVVNLALGLGAGYWGIRREAQLHLQGFEELERRNSNFGQLLVIQHTNQARRYYLNDWLTQNTYDPLEKKSTSMFTYMLHGLAKAYTPKIERALCIGLGVGIVPMSLAEDGAKVDVVEINADVAGVAQRHFNFQPEKVTLHIDDGRHYLNECAKRGAPRYDTIVLDAFLGDSSPSHLMTREAFTAMRDVLKPGGTLVINSFGDLDDAPQKLLPSRVAAALLGERFMRDHPSLVPRRNYFTASLERTLTTVFKSVRIHTAFGGNILFVASDTPDLQFAHPPDFSKVHPYAIGATQAAFENIVSTPPHAGRVLTDNFNPVEYYDLLNREGVRKNLTVMWRNQTIEE